MKDKFLLLALISLVSCTNKKSSESSIMNTGDNWPSYGGNKAGNRYSPLDQININNVKNLQLAWMYDARDNAGDSTKRQREIQCQPIVVNGILYGTTPDLNLFAVDAATGKQVWKFESTKDKQRFNTNRGVMYWEDSEDKRIFLFCWRKFVCRKCTYRQSGGKLWRRWKNRFARRAEYESQS